MKNTNLTNTNTSIARTVCQPEQQAVVCSKDGSTRDYQDMVFQFREDGYFNMTKAAKHFGKDLSQFMRSPDTIDYLEALAHFVNFAKLIETKAGRCGGSWGHPKLAVFFARWLNVKFADWYAPVLEDQLRGKAEVTITKPEESAVLALPKDYASALRALANSVEAQEKLQNKTVEQAKKIDHLTSLMKEAAEILGIR